MSPFDNPTQLTGFLSFLTASVAVLVGNHDRKWLGIGIFQALFAAEILANQRHQLRMPINDMLQEVGIYGDRIFIQAMLVGLLIVASVFLFIWLSRWLQEGSHDSSRLVHAWLIVCGLMLFFLVELVSLHQLDALLYAKFADVMFIGWCWLLAALATIGLSHRANRMNARQKS